MNSLDRLLRLLPPLSPPPENQVDWALASDVYGVEFPVDFREFVAAYGNVLWCDLFRPLYPNTQSRQSCLQSRDKVTRILAAMYAAKLWDRDGKRVTIPPYPATGGLLPCLFDTNSDVVCWRTEGHPDQWTTALFQEGNVFFYPFGVTQLIADWIEQIPPAAEVWGVPNSQRFGLIW